MWATLRVRRMVPKGDGGTEHHHRPITITWGCHVDHPSRVQKGRVLWSLSGYGFWSDSRGMPPRLEDEDYYERKDEEQEKEDALPPASILLIPVRAHEPKRESERMGSNFNRYQTRTREGYEPSSNFKLPHRIVHVDSRLLNIVFDTVKECALVYDE